MTIIEKINNLPDHMKNIIFEYIERKYVVFTNKKNYFLYHHLIKKNIINYSNYIRDIIRRDNHFVFHLLIRENFDKWIKMKQYIYKNMIFINYVYFLITFCIENDSNNCRNIIVDFFTEHGLGKNLHKKNIIKYIRWKN